MSYRITTCKDPGEATIQVEGRLAAAGAAELRREFQSAGRIVSLDLAGLVSADETGTRVLLELQAQGAGLVGPSAYVRQLLEEASSRRA